MDTIIMGLGTLGGHYIVRSMESRLGFCSSWFQDATLLLGMQAFYFHSSWPTKLCMRIVTRPQIVTNEGFVH